MYDAGRAAAADVRFMQDARALHGPEAAQTVETSVAGATSDFAANAPIVSWVNGR